MVASVAEDSPKRVHRHTLGHCHRMTGKSLEIVAPFGLQVGVASEMDVAYTSNPRPMNTVFRTGLRGSMPKVPSNSPEVDSKDTSRLAVFNSRCGQ